MRLFLWSRQVVPILDAVVRTPESNALLQVERNRRMHGHPCFANLDETAEICGEVVILTTRRISPHGSYKLKDSLRQS